MSDCCPAPHTGAETDDGTPTPPSRRACPVNGNECAEVPRHLLLHHLSQPWQTALPPQRYYFCDDPSCAVVYFGDDDRCYGQDALRTQVGCKRTDDDATVCYCYGVRRAEARDDPSARVFVIEQTRLGHCACDSRNPSGRCCLKDFPRPSTDAGATGDRRS